MSSHKLKLFKMLILLAKALNQILFKFNLNYRIFKNLQIPSKLTFLIKFINPIGIKIVIKKITKINFVISN
jgi:hypothetical protein